MINSEDIKSSIGKNLKKLRTFEGLTQEKLAECTTLDVQTIKNIETGRVFISANSLALLSNYFNSQPSYFFDLKPVEHFAKDLEIKKEINRILSEFDTEDLLRTYKIVAALKS